MSSTPLGDAVKDAGTALAIEGGASQHDGAAVSGTFSHKDGAKEIGVEGGISQRQGWSVKGFFKWVWGAND